MIKDFRGDYAFLSNFHPCAIVWGGVKYPTLENAFQSAKTTDKDIKLVFANCTPGEAKRMGREIDLISGWEQMKDDVMLKLVRKKFNKKKLQLMLLATGAEELIEGNWWGDTYWGVFKGKGQNRLGKILMNVRAEIKKRKNKIGRSDIR